MLIIKFVWQTRVGDIRLRSPLKPLSAPFAKLFLQQNHIPSVALVHGVCYVTNEWYQSNSEVNRHVENHAHFERGRQFGLHRATGSIHHIGETEVNDIADAGKELV